RTSHGSDQGVRYNCKPPCGRLHCSHGVEKPEPLPVIKNRDERRKAARDHPGTCDVHQAELIAAVSMESVK
ncbi:unnamed protein product, partial [Pylaiella littoralis]